MDGQSGRTVFVRNIPFKATNEGLASVFEDDGPLKHCFVVKEKGELLHDDRNRAKYTKCSHYRP